MKEVTRKNHFLIKIDEEEKQDGLEKTKGGILMPVEQKSISREYRTATILKVSKVISEEYEGLYEEGDKIMIYPVIKGNIIDGNILAPVDVIFGKI